MKNKYFFIILSLIIFNALSLYSQIQPVIISEVFYDTPLEENWLKDYPDSIKDHHNGEFIELFNPSSNSVNISGWKIIERFSGFIFPENTIIPSRSFLLLVYRDPESGFVIEDLFPEVSQKINDKNKVIYHSTPYFWLSNKGEPIVLIQKDQVIDEMSYGSGQGLKMPKNYWQIFAENYKQKDNNLLKSIQRRYITYDFSGIISSQEDYYVSKPTPLSSSAEYELPYVPTLYPGGTIDTSLDVGTIYGEAGVNQTGAATYTIPISVPPGTNGVQPQINIVYNSQSGFGSLGIGWDLSPVPVISRGVKSLYFDSSNKNIQFDNTDPLYLDGQRLILLSGTHFSNDAVYGTEIENYTRVKIKGSGESLYFELTTKEGVITEFGKTGDSKLKSYNNIGNTSVLAWKTNKTQDIHGNAINYTYTEYGRYLYKITYANNSVVFSYSWNTVNPPTRYYKNFIHVNQKLLSGISINTGSTSVKNYTFEYVTADKEIRLSEIKESYGNKSTNPIKISWMDAKAEIKMNKYMKMPDKNLLTAEKGSLYSGDINGDGKQDLIEMYLGDFGKYNGYIRVNIPGCHLYTEFAPEILLIPKLTVGDINNDGKDEIMLILLNRIVVFGISDDKTQLINKGEKYYVNINWGLPYYYTNAYLNDENNDGYLDLVVIPYKKRRENASLILDDYIEYNMFIFYGNGTTFSNSEQVLVRLGDVYGAPGGPLFGDFNADGKIDILHLLQKQKNNSLSPCGKIFESKEWGNELIDYKARGVIDVKSSHLFSIDFNNDGYTDILAQYKDLDDKNKDYSWFVLKNRGGYFSEPEKIKLDNLHRSKDNKIGKKGKYENSRIYPLDYNGDGLIDIVIADEGYRGDKKNNPDDDYIMSNTKTDWFFYRNTGTGFTFDNHFEWWWSRISEMGAVITDVNKDGVADLVMGHANGNYVVFSMEDAGKRNLVHKIANGMGQIEEFIYTNYDDPNFKSPVSDSHGVRTVNPSFMVVKTHKLMDGSEINYTYSDAKIHKEKGFLGFTHIIAKNERLGTLMQNTYEIETNYFSLLPKKQLTLDGSANLLSSTEFTNSTITIDSSKKRFIPVTTKKVSFDALQSLQTITNYEYDSNGRLIKQATSTGNYKTTVEYSGFTTVSGSTSSFLFLPQNIKTTYEKTGQNTVVENKICAYTAKGQLSSSTVSRGAGALITTAYTYFATGNLKKETLNDSGIVTESNEYFYEDGYYKYPTSVKNHLGYTTTYIRDPKNGNILSSTDYRGHTTSYTYDSKGALVSERHPNGEIISHNTVWTQYYGGFYIKTTINQTTNNAIIVYYDRLGREILTERTGWNGIPVLSSKEYNIKNQVTKKNHPRFESEPETYTDYTYDEYGRVNQETHFDGINTKSTYYSYDGRIHTVSYPDGNTSSSQIDETGNVVRKTDAGGVIIYEYNALGDPVTMTANGIVTSMEYNAFGNKTKLVDPSAGITRYRYYGVEKIKAMINAKGDSTVYFYDNNGRLVAKYLYSNEYSTLQTQYTYINSGNGIGEIAGIELYQNNTMRHKKTYMYNSSHLLQTELDEYEGNHFAFSYTYDNLWRLASKTSPSNLIINYEYSEFGGDLNKIYTRMYTAYNQYTDKTVWQLGAKNSKEQVTAFRLGEPGKELITERNYLPNGLLAEIKTVTSDYPIPYQHMQYEYDDINYNLIAKKDKVFNRNEEFDYDELDRLTGAKLNGGSVFNMAYQPNGNISFKDDVGTYTYSNGKPYAMTGVEDGSQGGGLSDDIQYITYTPFNKIETVSQNQDSYRIEYGLDQQRIKTEYSGSNSGMTRYYFGDFEFDSDHRGRSASVDYIYAPSGLAAIYKQGTYGDYMYYVHTDNLGSVQAVTDEYRYMTSYYAYTPWGGRILLEGQDITDRGYTGHEHLTALGLINMNGRVYDPVLARFLSPDPYVQAPGYTQSFNRYAYCFNNPFKYTDPDGEFIMSLIIGAAIGGFVNLVVQDVSGNLESTGDYFTAFGIGAAAGAAGAGVGMGVTSAFGGVAASGFISGASVSGSSAFTSTFVNQLGNNLIFNGQSFGQALGTAAWQGLVAGGTSALIGGIASGISAVMKGNGFWDGFDYQKALNDLIAQEEINNPNSKFLVANKKNARLVNKTFNTNVTKVRGNKIYMLLDGSTYSEYGANFGTKSKGNLTLISKQVIRDKAFFGLTDVVRHEGTHQLQVLAGMTARDFAAARAMEYGAYMTNILNPATSTTVPKVFNILVNDWGINYSTLWETILNLYPYGPIP